jgi:hypothetical protein
MPTSPQHAVLGANVLSASCSEPSQGTEEDQGASTSIWKARVGLKKEQDYRELSDRSVRSLEGSEREILEMHSKVTSLNGRVEVLEKLLAEVD